jgi:hypothetical protein
MLGRFAVNATSQVIDKDHLEWRLLHATTGRELVTGLQAFVSISFACARPLNGRRDSSFWSFQSLGLKSLSISESPYLVEAWDS